MESLSRGARVDRWRDHTPISRNGRCNSRDAHIASRDGRLERASPVWRVGATRLRVPLRSASARLVTLSGTRANPFDRREPP